MCYHGLKRVEHGQHYTIQLLCWPMLLGIIIVALVVAVLFTSFGMYAFMWAGSDDTHPVMTVLCAVELTLLGASAIIAHVFFSEGGQVVFQLTSS